MTNPADKRLIEDYIPIKAISAEASREKSIRHGHISTLHLWWARRPLVAARAAVFAALVPATAQPQIKASQSDEHPMSITKFMIELCKWRVTDEVLNEARRLVRESYPDNPPKVLDMFAGGGSIPLEALRLGAEAYALDLNPVAHIIELATLVYPQKYGAQLAEDVRKWGEWVLERVKSEVGDLYPLIADPAYTVEHAAIFEARPKQQNMFPSDGPEQMTLDQISPHLPSPGTLGEGPGVRESDDDFDEDDNEPEADAILVGIPQGYLQPVAYLWTRTVTCPNPACRATVPLVRQTWLKKKKGDNVALEMKPHPTENRMAFYVRKAADPANFGFDPAGFSQRGNSTCYRCGTTVTSDYIKVEGKAKRMGSQMMAIVSKRVSAQDKAYLSPDDSPLDLPDNGSILKRIDELVAQTGISLLDEPLVGKASDQLPAYGLECYKDIFTPRQTLALLTCIASLRTLHLWMLTNGWDEDYAKAVITFLAIVIDKMALRHNTLCTWPKPTVAAFWGSSICFWFVIVCTYA